VRPSDGRALLGCESLRASKPYKTAPRRTFADGHRLTIAVASRHTPRWGPDRTFNYRILSCFGIVGNSMLARLWTTLPPPRSRRAAAPGERL
jgi:hypothetical protein